VRVISIANDDVCYHAYGFAAFTVDPGAEPGGPTTMKVVYYDVVGPGGEIAPFETFTLRRPRRD